VTVKNTGSVAGSEVVQAYTTLPSAPDPSLTHVPLALRSFAKVRDLAPGESRQVELALDKYAVSYWEERYRAWVVEKGEYVVRVGPSSAVLPLEDRFVVEKSFEWNGL
jgi:beta-glucosidase